METVEPGCLAKGGQMPAESRASFHAAAQRFLAPTPHLHYVPDPRDPWVWIHGLRTCFQFINHLRNLILRPSCQLALNVRIKGLEIKICACVHPLL